MNHLNPIRVEVEKTPSPNLHSTAVSTSTIGIFEHYRQQQQSVGAQITPSQKGDEQSLLSSYRQLSNKNKLKVKDFIAQLEIEEAKSDIDPWEDPSNPWLQLKGIFATDPDFKEVRQEIERHRRELDKEFETEWPNE